MCFLHSKNEVPVKLLVYINAVRNKFNRTLKTIRSDNGTEYANEAVQKIFKREGIELQKTVPYSLQQNGVSKKKKRRLCESGRSMLFDAKLPTKYWGEAVMTACYIQNRLPTKAAEKTLFELWHGSKSATYVCLEVRLISISPKKRTKWDFHAEEGVLVGDSETSKGYRILFPATSKVTVVFDEDCGSFTSEAKYRPCMRMQDNVFSCQILNKLHSFKLWLMLK